MAKFCGKCGSKLDETTGLCPNCNADQSEKYPDKLREKAEFTEPVSIKASEEPLNKKEAKKKRKAEKKEQRAVGRKIKRIFLKLVAILMIGIIAVGTLEALSYLGIVQIPRVSSLLHRLRIDGDSVEFDYIETYEDYEQINQEALSIEKRYASANGSVSVEQLSDIMKDLDKLAQQYKANGVIESYDVQDTSIFMEFKSGVGYLYTPTVDGLMNGDTLGSILTVEPYSKNVEFTSHYIISEGQSPDKAAKKISSKLPDIYSYDKEDNWDSFSIEQVERLGNHKIIIWYGHGGYVRKYGSVLGTSIPITNQGALLIYNEELSNGEMLLGKDCFCLCPTYFEKHMEANSLDGSLIYLAACASVQDNRLANVFLRKGASLVVGNTRPIFIRYNLYMMYDFLAALTNQYEDQSYWTGEDALQYAKNKNGDKDGEFLFYGAEVKLVYPDGQSKYRLKQATIDSGSNGDLTQEGQFDKSAIPSDTAAEFNGHYYHVYDVDTVTNWEEAKKFCENQGGYLATITSAEENEFLYSYMKQCGHENAYFGLLDTSPKGTWEWDNGEPLSYTNWHQGALNNAKYDEIFAKLTSQYSDGTWSVGNSKDVVSTASTVNIKDVSATSMLVEKTMTHSPDKLIDGDLSTAWSEGITGEGIGESVTFLFDRSYPIAELVINAGYQKSAALYEMNSRPAEILLTFSDGSSESHRLEDINNAQSIIFNHAVNTESVTLTIEEVYPGNEYADGVITEVKFFAEAQPASAFICEWGGYQFTESVEQSKTPTRVTSGERNIVLTLDVSGSMSGRPLEETKKAATNFVDTTLNEDASIGIVTYDDSAVMFSDFSTDKKSLESMISEIRSGGSTNIEAGLSSAYEMLNSTETKKRIIVLMSDGEPNRGKVGDELVAYANELKEDGTIIYTIGFFESTQRGSKSSAQRLMEKIASDGCHYEVASADDLVFFFEDMADQINGQKYIYVRIACPVDVSVTYDGQTLSSSERNFNIRTNFGTLTFEESEETIAEDESDLVKVLRLKEGVDYDVKLVGTGRGIMNYTIGFMDDDGNYSDFRRFENIKVTRKTAIDTIAGVSEKSIMNIDEDGDGKYDLKLCATENGYGAEVQQITWVYFAIGGVLFFVIVVIGITLKSRKKKKGKVA